MLPGPLSQVRPFLAFHEALVTQLSSKILQCLEEGNNVAGKVLRHFPVHVVLPLPRLVGNLERKQTGELIVGEKLHLLEASP